MDRRDIGLLQRLNRVLQQQERLVAALSERRLRREERTGIVRLVAQLRALQTGLWNSLAARPQPRVLASARQVDALVEQWQNVAGELNIELERAPREHAPASARQPNSEAA